MDFRWPLEWPDAPPHTDDYEGRRAFNHITHGRSIGLDLDKLERRAKGLLYYWGSPPGSLGGSQYRSVPRSPYYIELFAHEMGHVLHVPYSLAEVRRFGMNHLIDHHSRSVVQREADINEAQASAATTLVLEFLGLSYDLWALTLSTTRNMRGRLYMMSEGYAAMRVHRMKAQTWEVARQIARHLLKMKNG